METQELLKQIKQFAEDAKAINSVIVDLKDKSSYADFIFICSGTSTTHNRGITEKIRSGLKQFGELSLGIEGESEAQWILMDFNTVVVHIFHEDLRDQYSLESLFSDSPQEVIHEKRKSILARKN